MASRPEQAIILNQANGSLRAESAGVWWSSMTYQKRMQHLSFIQNLQLIELRRIGIKFLVIEKMKSLLLVKIWMICK
ncbi:MAG: hypothetical protein ACPG49_05550 [Chitinophagales bacterium]